MDSKEAVMEENKNTNGQQTTSATGIFDIDKKTKTKPMDMVQAGTGVFPIDRDAPKNISEQTLKKRLARFAASRLVFGLAFLLSASAVLTAVRGYFWPVTLTLTLGRALAATAVWVVYASAGKKGSRLLAALPLYMTMASALMFVLLGVFVFCAMFGKMFLFSGDVAVDLVRSAHSAGLWAVLPALVYIMVAYCMYLFKRHERQLCCNIRDGLIYGFPFENGYTGFMRSCIVTACVLPAIHIARGVIGSFSNFGALSNGAAAFYDKLFMSEYNYWLALVGVLVHSAALVVAAVVGGRYASIVKKYKEQKEASANDKAQRKTTDALTLTKEDKTANPV